MRVLDAGCGHGRNVEYLLRCGCDVHAVDADPGAVAALRARARSLAPDLPDGNVAVAGLDDLPFADARFDAVICSAVLHFARDEAHFEAMVGEMWRVLAPGGVFFSRLASTIGLEGRAVPTRGRWHRLPDGSDRFLVDQAWLLRLGDELGGTLIDPLKTTVVQDMRSMTTWVLRKGQA